MLQCNAMDHECWVFRIKFLKFVSMDFVSFEYSFEYLSEEDESPSLFESEGAIKKLKNYKSAGLDEIFNEQLKLWCVSTPALVETTF